MSDTRQALEEAPSLYGPDGYFAKFTEMCKAIRRASEQIKADEERRSAAYRRGYNDGLKARDNSDG